MHNKCCSITSHYLVFTVAVLPFTVLPYSVNAASGQANNAHSRADAVAVPGEMLVQFRAGVSDTEKGRALGKSKAEKLGHVAHEQQRDDGGGDLILVKHQPDLPPQAARQALESDPAVEFAEPNWIYTHQVTSNDTYFTSGSLWGMYGAKTSPANQYGSNAASAWTAGTVGSTDVYVGVIDEGIQYSHPDLAGQIWNNPYDPADGIDNDGNGYKDDIRGWDFASGNNTIYDGGTSGFFDQHGTHVSGTIGALGGNNRGVVGVNWNIKIISAKFLGSNGGTTANAIKAIDYITDLKKRHGLNIVATNNSWGGGGFSQALKDAIDRANMANILFIAAAGNGGSDGVGDNNDSVANYPSNYDSANIIAVAAITSTGAKSSFSNYGATKVDIGAPGSGTWSTVPYNGYASYSGTSMATPHVTGAVALYASTHPGATAAQIKDAILLKAIPTAALAGKCVTGGRLDVYGALSK